MSTRPFMTDGELVVLADLIAKRCFDGVLPPFPLIIVCAACRVLPAIRELTDASLQEFVLGFYWACAARITVQDCRYIA